MFNCQVFSDLTLFLSSNYILWSHPLAHNTRLSWSISHEYFLSRNEQKNNHWCATNLLQIHTRPPHPPLKMISSCLLKVINNPWLTWNDNGSSSKKKISHCLHSSKQFCLRHINQPWALICWLQNPVVPVGPVAEGRGAGERKRGRDRMHAERRRKLTETKDDWVKQNGSKQAQVKSIIVSIQKKLLGRWGGEGAGYLRGTLYLMSSLQ